MEFFVHKGLLCHYSDYFRAALNGPFVEAQQKIFELEDEEVHTFRRFVRWLYYRGSCSNFGMLKSSLFCTENALDAAEVTAPNFSIHGAKLWIFGDRRGVKLLQDDSINFLHQYVATKNYKIGPPSIEYICANTTAASALAKFIAEYCAMKEIRKPDLLMADMELKHSPELVFNMAMCMQFAIANGKWFNLKTSNGFYEEWNKLDMCRFHTHGKARVCEAMK